jgi:hypothetical protein
MWTCGLGEKEKGRGGRKENKEKKSRIRMFLRPKTNKKLRK